MTSMPLPLLRPGRAHNRCCTNGPLRTDHVYSQLLQALLIGVDGNGNRLGLWPADRHPMRVRKDAEMRWRSGHAGSPP